MSVKPVFVWNADLPDCSSVPWAMEVEKEWKFWEVLPIQCDMQFFIRFSDRHSDTVAYALSELEYVNCSAAAARQVILRGSGWSQYISLYFVLTWVYVLHEQVGCLNSPSIGLWVRARPTCGSPATPSVRGAIRTWPSPCRSCGAPGWASRGASPSSATTTCITPCASTASASPTNLSSVTVRLRISR